MSKLAIAPIPSWSRHGSFVWVHVGLGIHRVGEFTSHCNCFVWPGKLWNLLHRQAVFGQPCQHPCCLFVGNAWGTAWVGWTLLYQIAWPHPKKALPVYARFDRAPPSGGCHNLTRIHEVPGQPCHSLQYTMYMNMPLNVVPLQYCSSVCEVIVDWKPILTYATSGCHTSADCFSPGSSDVIHVVRYTLHVICSIKQCSPQSPSKTRIYTLKPKPALQASERQEIRSVYPLIQSGASHRGCSDARQGPRALPELL